jgi:hypothetical protein
VARADEDEVAFALRHQREPAKEESTEEDLHQVGVRLDEPSQALRGQLENARRSTRSRLDDDRMAREEGDVAAEPAGSVHGDDAVRARQDFDRALDDDEERDVPVALLPKNRAVRKTPLASERLDPGDLLRGENREHLVLVRARRGPFHSVLDHVVVRIAVEPPLAGLVGADHGVLRALRVPAGVPVR